MRLRTIGSRIGERPSAVREGRESCAFTHSLTATRLSKFGRKEYMKAFSQG